jgi:hypothetical protein
VPNFVPPYGLEVIGGALGSDLGAEVRILDPFLPPPYGASVAASIRAWRPDVIGIGVRNLDIGWAVSPAGIAGRSCLRELRTVVDGIRDAAFPLERVLLGGVGFAAAPRQLLDELELPYGVVGPGAVAAAAFTARVMRGEPPGTEVPGLIARGGVAAPVADPTADLTVVPTMLCPHRRIARARDLDWPVRASSGCSHRCSYCVESTSQGRPARPRPLAAFEEELDRVAALGPRHVMLADGELNAFGSGHTVAVLRAVQRRQLGWRAYFLPLVPSPEERELLGSPSCRGVVLTVDSGAQPVLDGIGRGISVDAAASALEAWLSLGARPDANLIFGLPGETHATIEETRRFVRAFPQVRFEYSIGARVYPGAPLAAVADAAPGHVYGTRADRLEVSLYCEPDPPWELAQHLSTVFAEAKNVTQLESLFGPISSHVAPPGRAPA